MNYTENKEGIIVFDRGVSSRKVYDKFANDDLRFVTRVNINIVYKEMKQNKLLKQKSSDLRINQDVSVLLKDREGKWMKSPVRIIKATILNSKKDIYFLTNIEDISANEVACIYKQR